MWSYQWSPYHFQFQWEWSPTLGKLPFWFQVVLGCILEHMSHLSGPPLSHYDLSIFTHVLPFKICMTLFLLLVYTHKKSSRFADPLSSSPVAVPFLPRLSVSQRFELELRREQQEMNRICELGVRKMQKALPMIFLQYHFKQKKINMIISNTE